MSDDRQSHKRRVIVYVFCVCAASVCAYVFFVLRWGATNLWRAAFFCALYASTARFSIDGNIRGIPRAGLKPQRPRLSTSFLILLAAAFATNPATVATVAIA